MKTVAFAVIAALATMFAVTSFAASPETLAQANKPCDDCGKLNEPCPSPVICCAGLTCLSSSGGTPTCVER